MKTATPATRDDFVSEGGERLSSTPNSKRDATHFFEGS